MSETRAHETIIELDATPAEVWDLIATGEQLSRWFAPNNSVEPGVGGQVVADWGPGLEWRTSIEVWEPGRHLRLAETRDKPLSVGPAAAMTPQRLIQDFYIETRNGRTVLRLVHSGFGATADWDGEFEGTRGGWRMCFFRLKEMFERHRGEEVANLIVNRHFDGVPVKAAFDAVRAIAPGRSAESQEGDGHYYTIVPHRNRSAFTMSASTTPGGSAVYVEWLLFGSAAGNAAAVREEWRRKLDSVVAR
ncbi:MAG: SRPBCC domain-containing protein [Bryobacteraceae bacterium]